MRPFILTAAHRSILHSLIPIVIPSESRSSKDPMGFRKQEATESLSRQLDIPKHLQPQG
ncbi:MAG: hypothetical protein HUU55_00645 [Myxococcales bacterium]|nr:hypothetical protein [Myxococcales bacterium]